MIQPDGVQSAADREKEFHPKQLRSSTPITAWQRRADTLHELIAETNALRREVDELKARIASLPF